MKKYFTWISFIIITITASVAFTSCKQDACKVLNCQNGGVCADGLCDCPYGYTGSECQTTEASYFVGKYAGYVKCSEYPRELDTIEIELVGEPNKISLKLGFGNSSLLVFHGDAKTPQTYFSTYINENVSIHAYVTVNGDELAVFLETIDRSNNTQQACYFNGIRIKEEDR